MKKNMKSTKSNSRGFTLIEVMLVLAIMGLIALLAFRAFREASINRRDNQRRDDAGYVLTRLQQYKEDHGDYPKDVKKAGRAGRVVPYPDGLYHVYDEDPLPGEETEDRGTPGQAWDFYNNYMGGARFLSPSGEPYGVMDGNDVDLAQHPNDVRYVNNYKCDATKTTGDLTYGRSGISPSDGNIAVQITLERGPIEDSSLPNRAYVCRDDTK